jgi:nicotinamidase-related amidase
VTSSNDRRPSGLLEREQSLLLVIDVQERYLPHLAERARLVEAVRRLIAGAKLVDVPILLTEQYPQGLGHTADVLRAELGDGVTPIEKRSMSCLGEPAFRRALDASGRRQVVVAGIEAHACVNQTVHELLAHGVEVHVAIDAIDARFARDREVALARVERAGAIATTVESVLLEWVRTADSPEFQPIRGLIRDPLPEG